MRRTLALVCLAVTSMVALAFLIPLALSVSHIARDTAVTDAQRQAAAIGPVLAITTDRTEVAKAVARTHAGAAGQMAVHLPSTAAARSALTVIGTPHARAADLAAVLSNGRSVTAAATGGAVVLQPVALNGGRLAVIEVYVPSAALNRGVTTSWIVISAVAVVLVASSLLVADRLAAQVVGAARRLARATAALGRGDLDVRVHPDGPPELRDAANAFNAMAQRMRQLLAAEREMAADLSHRLRTPLAALRLNAAALEQGPAAEQTRLAVDRLEAEVDRIIHAARNAPAAGRSADCDASGVLRERLEFWSALAEDERRTWHLIGADRPVPLPVARSELVAVVDALLGNIFRHTPEGAAFAVTLQPGDGFTGILFADAGPGIADPHAALERGRSGGGSTGLGLDIARRLAESTGGDVRIVQSPLGGAQVQVLLRTSGHQPDRPADAGEPAAGLLPWKDS
jgi:signal transduction histidine kinase